MCGHSVGVFNAAVSGGEANTLAAGLADVSWMSAVAGGQKIWIAALVSGGKGSTLTAWSAGKYWVSDGAEAQV